jgi:dolichyl-diphosphooligosaccharide--protein glycosyltransferase
MGIALSRVYDLLAERVAIGRSIRIGSVTLAALVLLAPSLWVYSGSVVGIAKAMSGAPRDPDHRTETNRLRREMTTWLRRNTPETSGFLDSRQAPEYGVLARWGEGHFIKYVARRPTVMGNFGDDLGREHFRLARSFFTAEPSRAEEILETLGVRYLVIRSMSESRVMARTLFARDGSRLGRYRLLHEVRPRRGVDVPSYKLFEFVKGAELSGRAPPRSLVKAELDLTTNLGRETRFEAVTESDATGHYRLRLPYATRGHPGSITTAERYQIRVGDTREGVAIDESAVQQGASVEGPSF